MSTVYCGLYTENMNSLFALIPVFPLLGFLVIGLFGKNLSKGLVGIIGCGTVFASLVLSVYAFSGLMGKTGAGTSITIHLFDWITAGNFKAPFDFLIDPLSCWFLLIITGVGFLIHVYSVGYMHDDPAFDRFFAYLNLFIFFMLLLVLGDSYLTMFVGWEGVGLC